MIFYYSSPSAYTEILKKHVSSFLLSFAVDAVKKWQLFYNNEVPLLIDSGAFTAWNKGKEISMYQYLRFCKTLPDDCIFVNLDVIPKTGSSQNDVDICCEKSYDNYIHLKDHLKNVLPVYHYKDHIEWAFKYLEHTDYIGVSPANDTEEEVKQLFLNHCFLHLPEGTKTHAFGYSAPAGVYKYPFYSIDSTVWMNAAKFSNVLMYYPNRRIFIQEHISKFTKLIGIPYDMHNKIPKELVTQSVEYSITQLNSFMNDVTNHHKIKDFSYLKSQQTLF